VREEDTAPVASRASSSTRYVPSSCPKEDGVDDDEEEVEEEEEEEEGEEDKEEEEEEDEEDEVVPAARGITGRSGGGGSNRVSMQSSIRTKFMIGLDRLSGPLPISSSDESSHTESLICWVTEVSLPTMVVTSAPNQHPGFPLPGFFPPLSGAFTLDLAKVIEKMEQDSTPKASCRPSPKDGVPVSCALDSLYSVLCNVCLTSLLVVKFGM
jgi:hypothetical protein